MSVPTKQNLPIPPGLIVRFEHVRRVVLSIEVHPNADTGPVPLYSEPLYMNSHEWKRVREQGFDAYVLPGGGVTRARLYKPAPKGVDEPDELIAMGEIICNPEDNYVKSMGRVKALGLARKALASPERYHRERKQSYGRPAA